MSNDRVHFFKGLPIVNDRAIWSENVIVFIKHKLEILNGFLHDFVFFSNPPPERSFNSSSFRL